MMLESVQSDTNRSYADRVQPSFLDTASEPLPHDFSMTNFLGQLEISLRNLNLLASQDVVIFEDYTTSSKTETILETGDFARVYSVISSMGQDANRLWGIIYEKAWQDQLLCCSTDHSPVQTPNAFEIVLVNIFEKNESTSEDSHPQHCPTCGGHLVGEACSTCSKTH